MLIRLSEVQQPQINAKQWRYTKASCSTDGGLRIGDENSWRLWATVPEVGSYRWQKENLGRHDAGGEPTSRTPQPSCNGTRHVTTAMSLLLRPSAAPLRRSTQIQLPYFAPHRDQHFQGTHNCRRNNRGGSSELIDPDALPSRRSHDDLAGHPPRLPRHPGSHVLSLPLPRGSLHQHSLQPARQVVRCQVLGLHGRRLRRSLRHCWCVNSMPRSACANLVQSTRPTRSSRCDDMRIIRSWRVGK